MSVQPEEIGKYIAQNGYRSIEEIRVKYLNLDREILDMHLHYLRDKGIAKRVYYDVGDGVKRELYYAPHKTN